MGRIFKFASRSRVKKIIVNELSDVVKNYDKPRLGVGGVGEVGGVGHGDDLIVGGHLHPLGDQGAVLIQHAFLFPPNPSLNALSTKTTRTIGVLLPCAAN